MNIALIGYGKMGKEIEQLAQKRNIEVKKTFTSKNNLSGSGLTRESLKGIDVCIDFSTPHSVIDNIEAVVNCGKNIVVGTTGWYDKLDEVKKLAEKYFESIPKGPEPRKIHTVEPEQKGERRVFVKREVPTPYLLITYHVPQTGSEDYYALELLNDILSNGSSSRLYKSLVEEQQLAIEIGTYYPNAFDPTLFYFYAITNDGIKSSQLENAIYQEIDKIIENGITDPELQKVKNQKLMEFYRTTQTINGMSNTIGTYELFFGDFKKLFSAPDDFKKVSKEQIQLVAKKYFNKENRTVGILFTEEEK